MSVFPSVEWFDEVRDVFNADDTYHGAGGGLADATVGIKVDEEIFVLLFEGMECTEARKVSESDLEDTDFYLDMSYSDWEEMLRNIQENGAADLDHTLNTLDLDRDDGLAQSVNGDQYRQDLFFRYNQTFQYFFDASARVDTQFKSSATAASDD